MKWLEQTHGTKFELVRHFLARMFDSEICSTRGQAWTVAVSALALAVPMGLLLLDPPYLPRNHGASREALGAIQFADQLAVFTLISAVTGVLALLAWQSLFPSRRDYLALAGLPVRPRQVFEARFASVLIMAVVLAVAMSLLPSLVAPHQFTAAGAGLSLPLVLARAACYILASLFVFFAVVSVQGAMLNLLSARLFARLSAYVQGALVALFFLGGLYSWLVVDWTPETFSRLPAIAGWVPPLWFTGLQQVLAGSRDPLFTLMASRGVTAAVCSVLLAALMYLVAYVRHRRALLESPDIVTERASRKWSLLGLLARDPRKVAILRFLGQVLSRSRMHRLVPMAYLGAGVAIMFNSLVIAGAALQWHGWTPFLKFAVLYWPIGLVIAALAGVRHAFQLPAEWKANWLFQITESEGRRAWMAAVERFVVALVIAPIHLVTLPVAVAVLGWPIALRMTALQVLVSLAAFDFLFSNWQQLPFACSYVPGKKPLVASIAAWLAVFGLVVPALTRIIAAMSQMWQLSLVFFLILAAVRFWTRSLRRETWGEGKLIYEDTPNTAPDLGIGELTYRTCEWPNPEPAVAPAPEKPKAVAVSLKIYRSLARAFPHEFRSAYGKEMLQLTEDTVDLVWQLHGTPGLGRIVLDIALRVVIEHLASLWRDVRYGIRSLAGSPGFTAVALLSLALGIGVATSAFSELNGFILRDVPRVARPGELVMLRNPISYPSYQRFRKSYELYSDTLAYLAPVPLGVSFGGGTERTWGNIVTASYFTTLGVKPILGRTFGLEDEKSGRAPNAVVSYRFWQNRFGSAPSVVGRTLKINGQNCTIVGVAPEEFQGASPMVYGADIWLPLSVGERVVPELAGDVLTRYDRPVLQFVARLQPGVAAPRVEAALDSMARQMEIEFGDPERNQKGRRVTVLPGGQMLPIPKRDLPMLTSYFTLLGGMILLIAASNVANMALARGADRRKEIAVRLAMGAGRWRLIRQLLTESMLIAAGAGVLGFLMASWVMRLASQMPLRYPMPISLRLAPDGRVLLFTTGLTLFTGLAFGLLPALRATRTDLTPALKDSGAIPLHRRRSLNLRNALMLSQVAASLALLLITGFLVIGHRRVMGAQVGFDAERLYLVSLDPFRDGFTGDQTAAVFRKLLDRVRGLPGITSASLTDSVPMSIIGKPGATFSVAGADGSKVLHWARRARVGVDYFDTLGIPILQGRRFRRADERDESTAAIVSERMARECWGGENPLGRRFEVGNDEIPRFVIGGSFGDRRAGVSGRTETFEVVGVARNTRDGLDLVPSETPAVFYLPLRPADCARPGLHGVTLMARALPGVDAFGAVRQEVAAIDQKLTPFDARTMPEQIDRLMFPMRAALGTYSFIGVFGLILASVGLAGVTAYTVARRRREIGIRIALGAGEADVLGLVMKEGAVLVLLGSAIGLTLAWMGMRALTGIMSEVARVAGLSTSDPKLLVGAPLLLAALALVACYLPARKSLRVDPVVALRQE